MRPPRSTPKAGPPAQSTTPLRGRRAHAGPPADEGADAFADLSPDYAPVRAGRWHMRPRTVRAKVVCLLMVPVVSLLALWAYATVTTAQDVSELRRSQRVDAELRTPVAVAVAALQAERVAAVRYAAAPDAARGNDLRGLAATTDRAVAELRLGDDSTVAAGQQLPAGVGTRLETFVGGAEQLRTLRAAVIDREADWSKAYDRYSRTIDAAFAVDGALSGIQRADVGSDARVLLEFSRAAEALAQENAVLGSTRPDDELRGRRLRLLGGAVANRRALTQVAVADLPAPQRAAWNRVAHGSGYLALTATEDRVLDAGSGAKAVDTAPGSAWATAHARVQADMSTIAADTSRAVAGRADPFTHGLLSTAGAAVLFGLAAVVASLVISVRIGRALVIELVSLRNDALEIARRKLPAAMRKLRAGAEIDIRAEAPAGPPAEDETGQVAEALTTVHRAALHAAVERAELASGISGVFVNLARRSQVLVHRQLSLLDSMERRSDDPNELSDLFRLDHLTTRMRRHAESLIILSGAAPGRAWRMPVSLTNVVRAAVSEIEDYARVEVRQLPEAAVIGAAVADLTHLLAELVENAAQFSPPHTRVRVSGEPVGNGYVLEVEDRGLGMGAETLVEANRRIEQSEALDLFDSDRLGLFVVSRLAARHGIKVHLRTSPYGGTTAVVLLPTALVHQGASEPPADEPPVRREPEREYARVPDLPAPAPAAVTTQAERPALAVSVPPPADPVPDTPPPGVSTLRPHRPPTDPESSDDLPRRVRQASIAPQLRKERPAEPAVEPEPPGDEGRTPELVRDRMAAYRDGWVRGGGRRPGRVAPAPARGSDSTEGEPA
ncbi:sensor histidine kinase [Streptomyces seoulensis]|uniref:sensor histidine kinase n=1 Tax=Streptomyces seoulensis TaxID=73044 RepID=UPI001FCB19BC|nr:sensor histidine kinase [Streptomyces seoulensis]BDH05281.1 ATPase [Streptomyces seoulensis]